MERTVSATQARIHFGEMMRRAVEEQETIIVEKSGAPQVVILSIAAYEQWRSAQPAEPAWLEQVTILRTRIAQERAGRPIPPVAELIHAMREERDEQLLGLR